MSASEEESLYKVLNVDENSTLDEIRKQYRVLALKHHPDKSNFNDDVFKRVTHAYNVLSDAQKRIEYDRTLFSGRRGYMEMPDRPMDASKGSYSVGGLSALFKDMMARSEKQQRVTVTLNLEEVLYGSHKAYHTTHDTPCIMCKGTGIENPDKNAIQCRECFGKGENPLMQFLSCLTCSGKGIFVINNRTCRECNGRGAVRTRAEHTIYLKPGTPDAEIIQVSKNVIVFVKHAVDRVGDYPVRIQNGAVRFGVDISLLELLGGFERTIAVGQETVCLHSTAAFDLSKLVRVRIEGAMDLLFEFRLVFDADNREIYAKIGRSLRHLGLVGEGGSGGRSHSNAGTWGIEQLVNVQLVNVNKQVEEHEEEHHSATDERPPA